MGEQIILGYLAQGYWKGGMSEPNHVHHMHKQWRPRPHQRQWLPLSPQCLATRASLFMLLLYLTTIKAISQPCCCPALMPSSLPAYKLTLAINLTVPTQTMQHDPPKPPLLLISPPYTSYMLITLPNSPSSHVQCINWIVHSFSFPNPTLPLIGLCTI